MKQPEKTWAKFKEGQLEARRSALTPMIALAHRITPHSTKASCDGRSSSHPVSLHHKRETKCRSGLDHKGYEPCLPQQSTTNLILILSLTGDKRAVPGSPHSWSLGWEC